MESDHFECDCECDKCGGSCFGRGTEGCCSEFKIPDKNYSTKELLEFLWKVVEKVKNQVELMPHHKFAKDFAKSILVLDVIHALEQGELKLFLKDKDFKQEYPKTAKDCEDIFMDESGEFELMCGKSNVHGEFHLCPKCKELPENQKFVKQEKSD